MKYIAFVCGHNSGRSQMAQAIFNTLKRNSKIDIGYGAISWGTGIGNIINPRIIKPLKKIGIDITDTKTYFPKNINHEFIEEKLPRVIKVFTMGCMDKVCELPPAVTIQTEEIVDWALEDPAKEETDVNAVRDTIIGKITELISELENTKL